MLFTIELEEAKRAAEATQNSTPAAGATTPDYAVGLTSLPLTPATPQPVYTSTTLTTARKGTINWHSELYSTAHPACTAGLV